MERERRPDGQMRFETMEKPTIGVGDRFVKLEDPETVWVVQRLIDPQGLPMHAELKALRYLKRKVMISVSALMDRNFYRRLEK